VTGERALRSRRDFLAALGAGIVALALPGAARGQDGQQTGQQTGQQDPQAAGSGPRTTMSGPMSESAYRPVALPARPGAKPSMSDGARDALEHQLHCQCGCTLDVFTCRTTDFTCPVSPGMHGDIVALVVGGYTAVEILDAFRKTYGERVLMSPVREGFNWAGYVAPFVALGAATVAVGVLIRRWREAPAPVPAVASAAGSSAAGSSAVGAPGATPDEMARLEAAVRDDRR
jgi:cytochrome c-type biogenesis protein CcmH